MEIVGIRAARTGSAGSPRTLLLGAAARSMTPRLNNVNLTESLSPSSVTVSNATFTFEGAGNIAFP